MDKSVLVVVIACSIAVAGETHPLAKPTEAPQSSSSTPLNRLSPQSFEGTWQGAWRGYGVVNHHETGSQSSLTVTIKVKVSRAGKLSGITSTSAWLHEPVQNARLSLGAPLPPSAPPPPLPTPPPSGRMLNARTGGGTFIFEVKDLDGKLVEFRLSLEDPDTGTLTLTIPTHARVYPEFKVKRVG